LGLTSSSKPKKLEAGWAKVLGCGRGTYISPLGLATPPGPRL